MKLPFVKKLSFGFHAAVLMSVLRQVVPSLDEKAWNVSISLFPGSLRLSYQIAWRLPFGSTAIAGSNWSLGAAAPLGVMLIVFAFDHVWPKSSDCWNEMSAPVRCRLMLF